MCKAVPLRLIVAETPAERELVDAERQLAEAVRRVSEAERQIDVTLIGLGHRNGSHRERNKSTSTSTR